MEHTVTHDLDAPLARKAARRAIETYQERFAKYRPEARWVGDERCELQFTAKGIKLHGTIQLRAGAMDIELEVPFLLRVFKKQAIDVIEREIRLWIGKAKAGEL